MVISSPAGAVVLVSKVVAYSSLLLIYLFTDIQKKTIFFSKII